MGHDMERRRKQSCREGVEEEMLRCFLVAPSAPAPCELSSYPCHARLSSFCCLSYVTITVSLQPPDRLPATRLDLNRESAGRRIAEASTRQCRSRGKEDINKYPKYVVCMLVQELINK